MAKKLLITGSAGFVFSNMVLYFLQHTEHDLISVDKLTYAGSLQNIAYNGEVHNKRHRFYLGDIADYHFMRKVLEIEKPDIIINGAAESHVDNAIKDASAFIQSNITGTHSILEAMRTTHMPERFINFSSDEVYGHILQGSFTENSPVEPRSPYSATKAAADLLCQSYVNTYQLPIITTRTSNIFGPRQREKLIPTCVNKLLNDQKIPLYGKGENIREWIFCKDVFYALDLLIEKGVLGEIYNIGSGEERTNIEVVSKILETMGRGVDQIEYVADRPGHDLRYSLDTTKLRALGWKPKYKFDEALKYTVEWYLKNRSWVFSK